MRPRHPRWRCRMVVDIPVAKNEPERSSAVRCVLPRACCTGCALCGRCRGNAGFHKRHEVRPCCPVTCTVPCIAACVMCVCLVAAVISTDDIVSVVGSSTRTHADDARTRRGLVTITQCCGADVDRRAGARVYRVYCEVVFIFGAGCMRLSYSMTILLPTLFVFSRPRGKGPYTHLPVLAGRVPAGAGPPCTREMRRP